MNGEEPGSHPLWSEEHNRRFYDKLKGLNTEERSRALIDQAQSLLAAAGASNHDLLKAAESLMTFWTLHVRHAPHQHQAHDLLYQIYTQLEEPGKAGMFKG